MIVHTVPTAAAADFFCVEDKQVTVTVTPTALLPLFPFMTKLTQLTRWQ